MSEPTDSKSDPLGQTAERVVGSAAAAADGEGTGVTDAGSVSPPPADLVENEPYLGPAWAVAMLILYALKETFPATEFSLYWWFQLYVVGLVVVVTIFALIKRHQFYTSESPESQPTAPPAQPGSSAAQSSGNGPR